MALVQVDFALDLSGGISLPDLAGLVSLLMLPFAHEDLAIVVGAYAIVTDWLPAGLVVLCIYGGMVASDFALYGIGAGARRLPWLDSIDGRVRGFASHIERDLFGLFALCRLVPGVVFVAAVACGWIRVPLERFAIASLVMSALYLPIMLYLVFVFGDALSHHVGLWSWPVLLAALFATAFVRRRVFAFGSATAEGELVLEEAAKSGGRRGFPVPSLRDQREAPGYWISAFLRIGGGNRSGGPAPIRTGKQDGGLLRQMQFNRRLPPLS